MTTPSESSYREIPLSKGYVALVDAADYEWLNQWRWKAHVSGKSGRVYAVRTTVISMHRQIMGLVPGDGLLVDHTDTLQSLDNRRSNLRLATKSQNSMNTRLRKDSVSGFKGVSKRLYNGKWRAYIDSRKKRKYLGDYDTPEAAHAAYCKAATELHGAFARTH